MTTNVNIIRVGNSNGIIIPAGFMKALCLKEKDRLEIKEADGVLSLRKVKDLGETPFSTLDRWNEEHNYPLDSFDQVPEYIKKLRSGRRNKEITTW